MFMACTKCYGRAPYGVGANMTFHQPEMSIIPRKLYSEKAVLSEDVMIDCPEKENRP